VRQVIRLSAATTLHRTHTVECHSWVSPPYGHWPGGAHPRLLDSCVRCAECARRCLWRFEPTSRAFSSLEGEVGGSRGYSLSVMRGKLVSCTSRHGYLNHAATAARWFCGTFFAHLRLLNSPEFTKPEFTNSMHGARNPDHHSEKSEFRVGDKLGGVTVMSCREARRFKYQVHGGWRSEAKRASNLFYMMVETHPDGLGWRVAHRVSELEVPR
jgi:hypothetical protein